MSESHILCAVGGASINVGHMRAFFVNGKRLGGKIMNQRKSSKPGKPFAQSTLPTGRHTMEKICQAIAIACPSPGRNHDLCHSLPFRM